MGHGGAGRFGGAASPERQRLPGRCGAELPRKTVSNEHRVDVARSVCRRDGHVRQGAGTHKGDKAMSRSSYPPVRRALDVVAASVAILLLSIPLLIITLLIKLSDPRAPILFRQRRCG